MTDVFLVEQDDYDGGVMGAFSTLDAARAYVRAYPPERGLHFTISQCRLDPHTEAEGFSNWIETVRAGTNTKIDWPGKS